MNLSIVGQYFYPDTFRSNIIVKGVVQRGHSVKVLPALPYYESGNIPKKYRLFKKRKENYYGTEITRMPTTRRKDLFWRAPNYAFFMTASTWCAAFARVRKYDVIMCYQTSPVMQSN